MARNAAAISYQGSIRRVPRNWVKSYVSPTEEPTDVAADPLPAASTRRLPEKLSPPSESSIDAHPASPEVEDSGVDADPGGTSPLQLSTSKPLPVDSDGMDGEDMRIGGKQDALDELLDLPGRAFQEKCNRVGYGQIGIKRELPARILG